MDTWHADPSPGRRSEDGNNTAAAGPVIQDAEAVDPVNQGAAAVAQARRGVAAGNPVAAVEPVAPARTDWVPVVEDHPFSAPICH